MPASHTHGARAGSDRARARSSSAIAAGRVAISPSAAVLRSRGSRAREKQHRVQRHPWRGTARPGHPAGVREPGAPGAAAAAVRLFSTKARAKNKIERKKQSVKN